jgi:hypothetical protein
LGNGDGTLGSRADVTSGGGPFHLAVADLNNDGNLDIVATGNLTNTVSVLLGQGDGNFGPFHTFDAGSAPIWVDAADLNHDGNNDLVVRDQSGVTTAVLLGNGDGTFQSAQFYSPGGVGGAIADFNGDGNADFVTGNSGLNVLLGNGDGSFQAAVNFATDRDFRMTSADVNGDGHADLLGVSGLGVSVLLNTSFV